MAPPQAGRAEKALSHERRRAVRGDPGRRGTDPPAARIVPGVLRARRLAMATERLLISLDQCHEVDQTSEGAPSPVSPGHERLPRDRSSKAEVVLRLRRPVRAAFLTTEHNGVDPPDLFGDRAGPRVRAEMEPGEAQHPLRSRVRSVVNLQRDAPCPPPRGRPGRLPGRTEDPGCPRKLQKGRSRAPEARRAPGRGRRSQLGAPLSTPRKRGRRRFPQRPSHSRHRCIGRSRRTPATSRSSRSSSRSGSKGHPRPGPSGC